MQSILAISWFPTAALICGLVFGVLTLSCACLMIIKEQRPSGLHILLAILGSLLLVVSIWQSRQLAQELAQEGDLATRHASEQNPVMTGVWRT